MLIVAVSVLPGSPASVNVKFTMLPDLPSRRPTPSATSVSKPAAGFPGEMAGLSEQRTLVSDSRWNEWDDPAESRQLICRLLGFRLVSQWSSKPCVTRNEFGPDVNTLPPPVILPPH